MEVYVDIIFLLNLVMNAVILLLTAFVNKIAFSRWRVAVAAVTGSLFVICSGVPQFTWLNHPLMKSLLSLLLILLSFGYKTRKELGCQLIAFYLISFALGGAIVGWLFFWQSDAFPQHKESVMTHISGLHILVGSSLGIVIILYAAGKVYRRNLRCNNMYRMEIQYDGKSVQMQALLDTGNHLYTMTARHPVILVEYGALPPLLSRAAMLYLTNCEPSTWLTNLTECQDTEWLKRIQLIPYHAIGNRNVLLGFRPDHVAVVIDGKKAIYENVVIGLYGGSLSTEQLYSALLHPALVGSGSREKFNEKEEADICA